MYPSRFCVRNVYVFLLSCIQNWLLFYFYAANYIGDSSTAGRAMYDDEEDEGEEKKCVHVHSMIPRRHVMIRR